MNIKPQDILLLLHLVILDRAAWTRASLAATLGLGAGEVHRSLERAAAARLYDPERKRVRRASLLEFLVHGLKYAFPAIPGTVTRGVPTCFASPLLKDRIAHGPDDDWYVWPFVEGTERGIAIEPLYPTVPKVALVNPKLYGLLGLVDAIRIGGSREAGLAVELLKEHLAGDDQP